jgi:hypothetical protein
VPFGLLEGGEDREAMRRMMDPQRIRAGVYWDRLWPARVVGQGLGMPSRRPVF